MAGAPFDAVLVVAFGGPEGMADVRPFLDNVLRGRRVTPERVDEVARHYEHFGGVSPLAAITRRQVDGLKRYMAARGLTLPVYLGMRNWHPLLPDTLKRMAKDGVKQAIGFVCAPHRSYSSCRLFGEHRVQALDHPRRSGNVVEGGHGAAQVPGQHRLIDQAGLSGPRSM